MAIENAMLAGGAALSLLAGVCAGQYALLPSHGGSEAREMTPLRFTATGAADESRWQEARWTPPPALPARAAEKIDLSEDETLPPDPPSPAAVALDRADQGDPLTPTPNGEAAAQADRQDAAPAPLVEPSIAPPIAGQAEPQAEPSEDTPSPSPLALD